jgi:DNA-binding LacI/PurR family transcriptional regulator
MPKKSITSYDVAKAADVSQSAVSRAFSPGASIAKEKRERILKMAAELGYQPNAMARSMSSARRHPRQQSGIVGVIVTRLEDPFFAHTISHFSRQLQDAGWHMLLFTIDSEEKVDEALASLMQYKVDGVIILSAILSSKMAAACADLGTKVLLYNRTARHPGVNSVQIDNAHGGRTAADLLLAAGHGNIAFIGGAMDDETTQERKAGFEARLAEDGLEVTLTEFGGYTFVGGREAGLRLFSRLDKPDAIFCASDVMALGVLHAARYDLGLKVPEDFSLIGFDDIPSADWPGHGLTTIRQPIRRMITEAARVLIDQMTNPTGSPVVTHFQGELILRSSVRRVGRL